MVEIPPIDESEFADDDIIKLIAPNGEEIEFVEIAGIAHKGNFYAILQPVELLEGMQEDDAIVFKVTRGKDGTDNFDIELDEEIIEAVFAEYNRIFDNVHSGDDKDDN